MLYGNIQKVRCNYISKVSLKFIFLMFKGFKQNRIIGAQSREQTQAI